MRPPGLTASEEDRIGTWNVRGMTQGKMEIVKRQMIRTRVEMLGVHELHWTGMRRVQSGNHTVFYSGHKKTRRNGVAIICADKMAQSVLGYNPISDRIISIRMKSKSLNITFLDSAVGLHPQQSHLRKTMKNSMEAFEMHWTRHQEGTLRL